MVYLASPYSDPSPVIRAQRYQDVRYLTAYLTKQGHVIYSPIVHFHSVAEQFSMPTDFDFWQRINFAMIDRADALWVHCQMNWVNSKGVAAEIEYAKSLGLPVSGIRHNNFETFPL